MIGAKLVISKKYANAFLNVFIDEISPDTMRNVGSLGSFLLKKNELFYFLGWPVVPIEAKIKALDDLIDQFSLGKPFKKLVALLAQKKRLFLIGDVLRDISSLYDMRTNNQHFTFTSSHELTVDECQTIKRFLANITGASIIYDYKVDKNLIAGIRLQSKTYLWQYSIRKQLDDMKLSLIR